jgi:hypothetical protein
MLLNYIQSHALLLAELAGLLGLLAVIVTIAGVAMARFDGLTIEDGVYFAFITALTVGFGDFVPRPRRSRVISILLAMLGMLLLGIVVSVSVHALDLAIGMRE